jgi:hypothetical protein
VNLKTLRAVRRVQVTGLALAGADLPLVIVGGSLGLLLAAVFVTVAWAALICAQTQLIRRREYLDRPRPDYSAIARMEMESFGRTFEHAGAPSGQSASGTYAILRVTCNQGHDGRMWADGRGKTCPKCETRRGAFGTLNAMRRERRS